MIRVFLKVTPSLYKAPWMLSQKVCIQHREIKVNDNTMVCKKGKTALS
jgi:hypothetical protein